MIQVRQTLYQYASDNRGDAAAIQKPFEKSGEDVKLNPVKLIAYFYEHHIDFDFPRPSLRLPAAVGRIGPGSSG